MGNHLDESEDSIHPICQAMKIIEEYNFRPDRIGSHA